MFYQEKSIQSHLTCKICQSMYNDPRLLPCSHSFCDSCISGIIDDQTSSVTCPECNVSHECQASGFPFIKVLADLVAVQPKQVTHSKIIKELRQLLQSLQDEHDSLSNRLKKGSEEIREHCQRLRNQVDLETERRIEEIREIGDQMRKQIDDHEAECLRKFNDSGENAAIKEIQPALSRVSDFYSRAVEFLNQCEIDDDQVTQWIKQSKEHRDLLQEKSSLLTTNMTLGKLEFVRNESKLESSLIGTLNLEPECLQSVFNTKSFDIQHCPARNTSTDLIDVVYFEADQAFYSLYEKKRNFWEITCRVKGVPMIIFDTRIKITSSHYDPVNPQWTLRFFRAKNKIVFVIIPRPTANLRTSINGSTLHITDMHVMFFNMDLKLLKEYRCPPGKDITANRDHIFVLHDDRSVSVRSLDWDDFSPPADYFDQNIPQSCEVIQASTLHLFMLHQDAGHKQMRIFDIETECVVRELNFNSLDFSQFSVSYDYLIFFNNRTNRLKLYDSLSNFKEYGLQLNKGLEDKGHLRQGKASSKTLVFFSNNGDVIFF